MFIGEAFNSDATRLLPSSSNNERSPVGARASIDFARLYLMLGFSNQAWLKCLQTNQLERSPNVFSLLIAVVEASHKKQISSFQGFERLLEIGSQLGWLYDDPYEGVVNAAAMVVYGSQDVDPTYGPSALAKKVMKVTQFGIDKTWTPLCTSCETQLSDPLTTSGDVVLWGSFSFADITSLSRDASGDTPKPLGRINVLCDARYDTRYNANPVYAVDETQSNAIMQFLGTLKFAPRGRPRVSVEMGIIKLHHWSGLESGNTYNKFFDDIVQSSPELDTLADSLELLGRSKDQIWHWAINYETTLPFDAVSCELLVARLNNDLEYEPDWQMTRALGIENWRNSVFGSEAIQVPWTAHVFDRAAQDLLGMNELFVGPTHWSRHSGLELVENEDCKVENDLRKNPSPEEMTKTRSMKVMGYYKNDKDTFYSVDEFRQLFRSDGLSESELNSIVRTSMRLRFRTPKEPPVETAS